MAYNVGDRSGESAMDLIDDLRGRLGNGKAYPEIVEGAFGADVDYAQLANKKHE